MHRLGGLDASFLYLETSSQVLHVCGLVIVDPSTMPGGYSFHKVAGELGTRIKLPGGRAELCTTLHHACVDGVTEASLRAHLCGLTPDAQLGEQTEPDNPDYRRAT